MADRHLSQVAILPDTCADLITVNTTDGGAVVCANASTSPSLLPLLLPYADGLQDVQGHDGEWVVGASAPCPCHPARVHYAAVVARLLPGLTLPTESEEGDRG